MNQTTLEKIQLHTQKKLNGWYKNAEIDHGVIGHAEVSIDSNIARIKYVEDGVYKSFSEKTMHLENESIDYFYNIWSEA